MMIWDGKKKEYYDDRDVRYDGRSEGEKAVDHIRESADPTLKALNRAEASLRIEEDILAHNQERLQRMEDEFNNDDNDPARQIGRKNEIRKIKTQLELNEKAVADVTAERDRCRVEHEPYDIKVQEVVAQVNNSLTDEEKNYLANTPRTKMDFSTQKKYVDKIGKDEFNERTTLI